MKCRIGDLISGVSNIGTLVQKSKIIAISNYGVWARDNSTARVWVRWGDISTHKRERIII